MSQSKPTLPKGTRDFGPEVSAKRAHIIELIKKNFRKYGFSQLETPSMENLSVLTGKYGDEGDQLLFKILNSGDFLNKTTEEDYQAGSKPLTSKIAEKGLRYDLTVPFARYVVMNQHEIAFPFKRFQVQPVWRADRPQRGRYREFYQCDADIIGSKSIWNEVELTLLIQDVFSDLSLEDFVIKINHREILFGLAKYVDLEGNEIPFCVELDKLEKIGQEKVTENLLGLGASPEKVDSMFKTFDQSNGSGSLKELKKLIQSNGLDEVQDFLDQLSDLGRTTKVEFDPSLARGLSYYTGIIFEVKPTSVQMGTICAGGRYDDLTGIFGLKDVSGVGISFGLDRIYDVISELNLFPEKISNQIDILILHFDSESFKHGQNLTIQLREKGIKTELYPDQVKIQKQFNYADKIGAPRVLVIGTEEMTSGQYTLKDMESGNQQKLGLDEIVEQLQG